MNFMNFFRGKFLLPRTLFAKSSRLRIQLQVGIH